MNLRVRSVTGWSRSAMFASYRFSLAKTLRIQEVHWATNGKRVAGYLCQSKVQ